MFRVMSVLVSLAATVALVPPATHAQQVDSWTAIQQVLTDLKADRQAVVATNLPLTDAESREFWPVYKEYRVAMDRLAERTGRLLEVYGTSLQSLTDDRADQLVKDALAIEKERAEVRERFMPRVRRVLPAAKTARFFQIEHRLDALVALTLSSEIPLAPIKR